MGPVSAPILPVFASHVGGRRTHLKAALRLYFGHSKCPVWRSVSKVPVAPYGPLSAPILAILQGAPKGGHEIEPDLRAGIANQISQWICELDLLGRDDYHKNQD